MKNRRFLLGYFYYILFLNIKFIFHIYKNILKLLFKNYILEKKAIKQLDLNSTQLLV